VDVLDHPGLSDRERGRLARQLSGEVRRLAHRVSRLVRTAHVWGDVPHVFDLAEVVEDAVSLVTPDLRGLGVRVTMVTDTANSHLLADRSAIERTVVEGLMAQLDGLKFEVASGAHALNVTIHDEGGEAPGEPGTGEGTLVLVLARGPRLGMREADRSGPVETRFSWKRHPEGLELPRDAPAIETPMPETVPETPLTPSVAPIVSPSHRRITPPGMAWPEVLMRPPRSSRPPASPDSTPAAGPTASPDTFVSPSLATYVPQPESSTGIRTGPLRTQSITIAAEGAAIPVRAETLGACQGLRVLVVDDEVIYRSATAKLLTLYGAAEVIQAGSIDEALSIVNEAEGALDLLFLDYRLPDQARTGRIVYDAVALKYPTLARHTIFLVGDRVEGDLATYFAVHDIPFIRKPYQSAQLLDGIAHVRSRH
jgi:CheY-like chemotaxis protein